MAITASGLYGLTIEKMFIDTAGESLEAEDNEGTLVSDSYTPDYDTHDFHADLTNELTTSGQPSITSTELTLSSGTMTFDAADTVFSSVTVTDAMAHVIYTNVGTSGTDQLVLLQDFVTAASASAADFTVQHNASGIFTLDYTP